MEKIERALEEVRRKQEPAVPAGHADGTAPAPGAPTLRTPAADRDALVKRRVIAGPCGTALTDSYKVLRTQVDQRGPRGGQADALMVTSAIDDEGKTLTALNLAISFAQQIDRAVLLVEADLRNPGLKELLGLDPALPGLADHLLDGRPLQDLIVRPIERLSVIPAGRAVANSPELLGSHRMKELMAELRRQFEGCILIFDTPPLLNSADALVFSEAVDAILMVVEAGKTPVDKVNKAKELLRGKPLIGLVLNKAR
ncbi:MAG: polysaccharide biosynthesis tyrosine autokinase [bacterium]